MVPPMSGRGNVAGLAGGVGSDESINLPTGNPSDLRAERYRLDAALSDQLADMDSADTQEVSDLGDCVHG